MPTTVLSRPGELAAVVPTLLGFVPEASAVLLSLRGARRRVGLVQRLPLPDDGSAPLAVLGPAMRRVALDGGAAVAAVLYPPPGRPVASVAGAMGPAAEAAGLLVADVVVVQNGRWRSWLCREEACCPAEGRPLPTVTEGGPLALVASEGALAGRRVLTSRAALVRSVAPSPETEHVVLRRGLDQAASALHTEQVARGLWALRVRLRADWCAALRRAADPRRVPPPGQTARLVVSLADPVLRDAVAGESVRRPAELRALSEHLCRSTVPPHDPPSCTLLATAAYTSGDGALARIALDRALDDDPAYPWALALTAVLDAAIPPEAVRRAVVASARQAELRLLRPGGAPA